MLLDEGQYFDTRTITIQSSRLFPSRALPSLFDLSCQFMSRVVHNRNIKCIILSGFAAVEKCNHILLGEIKCYGRKKTYEGPILNPSKMKK